MTTAVYKQWIELAGCCQAYLQHYPHITHCTHVASCTGGLGLLWQDTTHTAHSTARWLNRRKRCCKQY